MTKDNPKRKIIDTTFKIANPSFESLFVPPSSAKVKAKVIDLIKKVIRFAFENILKSH